MLSFTPQLAPMIQTETVLSKKVLVLESMDLDVSCIKQTHLCVCGLTQRNTQTKSTTTANDQCLDTARWWNRSCWRNVFVRDKPNVSCSWPPWDCLAFAIKLEHPTVRGGSLDPIALQGIFVGKNRRVPHGIKAATFRDDGEVEEEFTSTTVRTRDSVPFVRQCWNEVSN